MPLAVKPAAACRTARAPRAGCERGPFPSAPPCSPFCSWWPVSPSSASPHRRRARVPRARCAGVDRERRSEPFASRLRGACQRHVRGMARRESAQARQRACATRVVIRLAARSARAGAPSRRSARSGERDADRLARHPVSTAQSTVLNSQSFRFRASFPGASIDGKASGDLDITTTPGGARGSFHVEARDGSVGLPNLPFALPYTTLRTDVRLTDAALAEISSLELDGPLLSLRASGSIGRAALLLAAPAQPHRADPGEGRLGRASAAAAGLRIGRRWKLRAAHHRHGRAAAPALSHGEGRVAAVAPEGLQDARRPDPRADSGVARAGGARGTGPHASSGDGAVTRLPASRDLAGRWPVARSSRRHVRVLPFCCI